MPGYAWREWLSCDPLPAWNAAGNGQPEAGQSTLVHQNVVPWIMTADAENEVKCSSCTVRAQLFWRSEKQ